MDKVRLEIETVAIGNDNTDKRGWFVTGTAAICYDGPESDQGVHFVVPGFDAAAYAQLRDLMSAKGDLYEIVNDEVHCEFCGTPSPTWVTDVGRFCNEGCEQSFRNPR